MAIKLTAEAAGVELALTFVEGGNRRASEAWKKYAQARVNEMAAELENLQIDLHDWMQAEICKNCGGFVDECFVSCACEECGNHVDKCECTHDDPHDEDCDCYDCEQERDIRDTEWKMKNSDY